jgi:hypothetical protein
MTPDDRAEPPEQPKTTKLEAVPPWAVELTQAMKEGIAEVRADISLVSNDLGVLKQRVSIIESLRIEDEARAMKLSGGVRGLSNADLAQAAQLAHEKTAREALAVEVAALTKMQETQLAILGRLDKVASNPLVKTVVTILGTALATWAASKGLK